MMKMRGGMLEGENGKSLKVKIKDKEVSAHVR